MAAFSDPSSGRGIKCQNCHSLSSFRTTGSPSRACVREWRESLNLSLRDVAGAVGISVTALHQIEHGTDPQLTTARKLSEFFQVPTEKLWPCRKEDADDGP